MVLAPAMVAGTIASERERRTIEYLFASQLSNAEIVLGKLAARLVHVVYLVLVGVPVLALMMMLGGIAPEALLLLFIVTLSSMLAVCSLAMAVSVWSLRAREAVTRAYLVLFVLLVLPPLLSVLRFHRAPAYGARLRPIHRAGERPVVAGQPVRDADVHDDDGQRHEPGAWRSNSFGRWSATRGSPRCCCAAAATLAVRRVHLRQRTTAARRRWRLDASLAARRRRKPHALEGNLRRAGRLPPRLRSAGSP